MMGRDVIEYRKFSRSSLWNEQKELPSRILRSRLKIPVAVPHTRKKA